MTPSQLEALEVLIDQHGIAEVLGQIAAIANDKAEHILANYDDENLSDEWEAVADEIDALADMIDLPDSD